jgi:8-oxo-dGTP diphosphatase
MYKATTPATIGRGGAAISINIVTRISIICNIILVGIIIILLNVRQQSFMEYNGSENENNSSNSIVPRQPLNNRTYISNVRRINHSYLQERKYIFHGGHPITSTLHGSCFCSGIDDYCMCNPALAIDIVLISGTDHLWFVRRKDTNQLAIVGGFVDIGETVLDAVYRELYEETGLSIQSSSSSTTTTTRTPSSPMIHEPVLFGVYSDPRRDNRRHTVSAAYAIHLDGTEQMIASDDVKDVVRIPISDVPSLFSLFADQKTVVQDYIRLYYDTKPKTSSDFIRSNGDFASDIHRSICIPFNVANNNA